MTNLEFKIALEKRTLMFAVDVIRMLRSVPPGFETRNLRDQVLRSATAIGANYREANRAESKADFIHKLAIVAKEAAETEYWLQVLNELFSDVEELPSLLIEAANLTRIFDQSLRTLSGRPKRRNSEQANP